MVQRDNISSELNRILLVNSVKKHIGDGNTKALENRIKAIIKELLVTA